MKKILKFSACISIVLIMLLLILSPEKYIPVAATGVKLWAFNVLPSLFPFFFFSLLLTKIGSPERLAFPLTPVTEKLFRCNGIIAYVFFMSVLSGYPVGARLISELKGRGAIGKDEATRAATLCSTSGPLFVIGTVGATMFKNKILGFTLFFSHVLSAVICGIIFSKYGNFKKLGRSSFLHFNKDNILYECIYSSVISILCVGGFICIFYILSEMAKSFNLFFALEKTIAFLAKKNPNASALANGFVYGLIECTAGCKSLSEFPSVLSAAMACSLISFGGISIIFQSVIYLSEAKVKIGIFLLSKSVQMIISFIISLITLTLVNLF